MQTSTIITLVMRLPFLFAAPESNITDGYRPNLQPATSECGYPAATFLKPLIVNGESASAAGRWPWHASIWHRTSKKSYNYVCGGTLISEFYVLTAGHCASVDGNPMNERLIAVQLGSTKQNLLKKGFPVQTLQVTEVILHQGFSPRSFNDDLALLALRTKAMLNEFVRPICLPPSGDETVDLQGREAVTVGFGMTESAETSDYLRELAIPIVSYVTCLESNREVFGRALSAGVICAGNTQGSTVCNGDSGGGLYTREPEDGRWVLRGVTSFTAQRGWNDSSCSLRDYSAFVNVANYGGWIRYAMEHDEQEGFFKDRSVTTVRTEELKPVKKPLEKRICEKKCREYRRKGLTVLENNGPGQKYLYKDEKPKGLAYYISDDYAITTADLALECIANGSICHDISKKRVQEVIPHPEFRGGRDYNVALLLFSPADEPLWCISANLDRKLYFEGRQMLLSAVSEEAPTWMEFDIDAFIPSKRGAVVYNDHRDLAGLMHYPAGDPVVMTNVPAVLDWIESIVWKK
ncbi:coagulation factor XII-like [Uranotaenia lowii]|uniref:coagulation factor XII-like n=1 Tax=Uranotaenia lowii TaxID=190385 RepID=UPI0024783863|nr:coagulation factor XII-like [Uranotaenia lowii]